MIAATPHPVTSRTSMDERRVGRGPAATVTRKAMASRSDSLARVAEVLTWGSFVAATIVAGVTFGRPDGGVIAAIAPGGWISLGVDRLTALLLLLVTGVAATVQTFARRYLRAEPTQTSFVVLTLVATVMGAALVSAANLVTATVAWVGAGMAVVALTGLRSEPGRWARDRWRVRTAFAVGDGALVLATLLLTWQAGNVALHGGGDVLRGFDAIGWWAPVVAGLIVVAACARCALIPFSSWLPSTLAAPTPVSALLHAGVVNGGGFLIIRLTPVLDAWAPSWYLLAGLGTLTALWAAAVMSVTVDVKGSLVRSTSAQMGFMIVTVAAGLPAAALAHLVAHGLYKAALFLGAGGAVHEVTAHRMVAPAPPPRRAWPLDLLAAGAPALALVAAVVLVPRSGLAVELSGAKVALLGFAWAAGAVVLRGWLQRCRTAANRVLATAAVAVSCSLYVLGMSAFTVALEPTLPSSSTGPGGLAFLPLALGALLLFTGRAWVPATSRLHQRAYALALAQTHAVGRGIHRQHQSPAPIGGHGPAGATTTPAGGADITGPDVGLVDQPRTEVPS